MPNFKSTFTGGASVGVWTDPASGSRPSRINPRPATPHRRWIGQVGVQVTITATVAGVSAPLDAALGGNLFSAIIAENAENGPPPPLSSPGGQSSVQRFTPGAVGHYTIWLRRAAGGGVIHHLDVDS